MKTWSVLFLCAAIAAVLAIGCGGGKLPEARSRSRPSLPEGHPPVGGSGGAPMMGALGDEGPTDDNPLPLKLDGMNGVEELNRALAATEERRGPQSSSRPGSARPSPPTPPSATTRGRCRSSRRRSSWTRTSPTPTALWATPSSTSASTCRRGHDELHRRRSSSSPTTARRTMRWPSCTPWVIRSKGTEHFKKAMELGVHDERNLGERFYSERVSSPVRRDHRELTERVGLGASERRRPLSRSCPSSVSGQKHRPLDEAPVLRPAAG